MVAVWILLNLPGCGGSLNDLHFHLLPALPHLRFLTSAAFNAPAVLESQRQPLSSVSPVLSVAEAPSTQLSAENGPR